MTRSRRWLYLLLAVVAAAAAVLSFDALRGLAELVGFGRLAWLLPLVVDAGAAAGTLVWLGSWAPKDARDFARALALILLGGSVGGNALGHGLAALGEAPHWGIVVAVSAVPAAVLGACVHLAVLCTRQQRIPDAQPEPVVATATPSAAPATRDLLPATREVPPTPAAVGESTHPRGLPAARPDAEPGPGTPLEQRIAQIRERYETGALPLDAAVAQIAQAHARVGEPKPSRRATARALGLPDDHYPTRKAWEALP